MKALVTGGTGFLGSHLCRRLAEMGYEISVLKRPASGAAALKGLSVKERIGDITDAESVLAAVNGQDLVIHAAAQTGFTGLHNEEQFRINIEGTKNVVLACKRRGVRRLIHVSSVAAVGVSEDPERPANEDFHFNLEESNLESSWTNYHISKRRAEEVVLAGRADGLDVVVVNPSMIFGRKANGFQGARTMEQPLRHRIVVNGPGGCCIVHVSDVVEGILLAIQRGRVGERYILGGANVSFEEISRTVCRQLALTRFHIPIQAPVAECGNRIKGWLRAVNGSPPAPIYDRRFCHQYYDSTKAKQELGYQPRSFVEIVEECIVCLGWRGGRANQE